MNAARVLPCALVPGPTRRGLSHRVVAGALALSLLSGGLRPARAAGDDGTADSKVGVLMAVMCGFALKFAIPAPVPWAGVAAAACMFAFLDAAMSPDNNAPAQDPPPKP